MPQLVADALAHVPVESIIALLAKAILGEAGKRSKEARSWCFSLDDFSFRNRGNAQHPHAQTHAGVARFYEDKRGGLLGRFSETVLRKFLIAAVLSLIAGLNIKLFGDTVVHPDWLRRLLWLIHQTWFDEHNRVSRFLGRGDILEQLADVGDFIQNWYPNFFRNNLCMRAVANGEGRVGIQIDLCPNVDRAGFEAGLLHCDGLFHSLDLKREIIHIKYPGFSVGDVELQEVICGDLAVQAEFYSVVEQSDYGLHGHRLPIFAFHWCHARHKRMLCAKSDFARNSIGSD